MADEKEKTEKLTPVSQLVEDRPKAISPDDEADILCPDEPQMTIAGKTFTVRKLKLKHLKHLAREVMVLWATVFTTAERGSSDYLFSLSEVADKLMAASLDADPEWFSENADTVAISTWFRLFMGLHTASELRMIRENFTEGLARVRAMLKKEVSPAPQSS